jgi:hypothetical protein
MESCPAIGEGKVWLKKVGEALIKTSDVWPSICNAVERIVLGLAILVMFLTSVGYVSWQAIKMHLK